jgi:hypothetical protein
MEKQEVFCLRANGCTAIHLDVHALCDAIKMELEDSVTGDMLFEVYTQEMTEKEIDELPEFDGF